MDLRYLKDDEIEYEFELRGINKTDKNAMTRLINTLASEAAGDSEQPNIRNTRQSVTVEIKNCETVVRHLSKDIEQALREADDEQLVAVQSRIFHLEGRSKRLKAVAPDHNGIDRLLSKVSDLRSHMTAGRNSFGSGEQRSILNNEDMMEVLSDAIQIRDDAARGAIPKRNHDIQNNTNTDRPIRNESQRPDRTNPPWVGSLDNLIYENNGNLNQQASLSRQSIANAREEVAGAIDHSPPPVYTQTNRKERPLDSCTTPSVNSYASQLPQSRDQRPGLRQQRFDGPNVRRNQSNRNPSDDSAAFRDRQWQPAYTREAEQHHWRNPAFVNQNVFRNPASQQREPPQGNFRTDSQPRNHEFSEQPVRRENDIRRPAYARPEEYDEFAGGHRIRQWPMRFSGSSTGLEITDFLFRVERQAQLNGVATAALAIGIGDLLTDRAAQWFWTYQRKGMGLRWDQLREAFVRRFSQMDDSDHDIHSKMENRKQRQGESFADFCQDMEALAVRLTRRMREQELVDMLRRNMKMSLRKALWRQRIYSVDSLWRDCDEYERLMEEEENGNRMINRRGARNHDDLNQHEYHRRPRVSELDDYDQQEPHQRTLRTNEVDDFNHYEHNYVAQYSPFPEQQEICNNQVEALYAETNRDDRVITCWNCRAQGHTYVECDLPPQAIFCYSCGLRGVIRPQCTNVKCPKNLQKGVSTAGRTRPQQPPPHLLRRMQPAQPHRQPNEVQQQFQNSSQPMLSYGIRQPMQPNRPSNASTELLQQFKPNNPQMAQNVAPQQMPLSNSLYPSHSQHQPPQTSNN